MTEDKIKEQAIKDVVKRIYPSMSLVKTGITYTEACALVELCIQALPIEFVSRDSEPQEGDLIKLDGWHHIALSREDYARLGKLYGKRAHFVEIDCIADFDDKDQLRWFNDLKEGNGIVERNNKPCVYIEDIGVSDDR